MWNNDTAVIFDLDGTLLDTSEGIFGSVRYTETKMGLEPIDNSLLSQFVGPPPKDMYMKLYGLSEQEALKAVGFHREYGSQKAIFEAKIYNGIPEMLAELRKRGIKIAVATLKKQQIAEKILDYYGLSQLFDTVVGMNDEESLSKNDTIKFAMKNVCSKKAIMVGDSNYDYWGAKEAGVDFIGVRYGFGFNYCSTYDFDTISKPDDLLDLLNIFE